MHEKLVAYCPPKKPNCPSCNRLSKLLYFIFQSRISIFHIWLNMDPHYIKFAVSCDFTQVARSLSKSYLYRLHRGVERWGERERQRIPFISLWPFNMSLLIWYHLEMLHWTPLWTIHGYLTALMSMICIFFSSVILINASHWLVFEKVEVLDWKSKLSTQIVIFNVNSSALDVIIERKKDKWIGG